MVRRILLSIIVSFILTGTSLAQNCGPYPNALTNGTNANAAQVMENFTTVLNCVNNLAAGPKPPRGHIFGLTLSNNTTDPVNDIDIAAGEAASTEANQVLMTRGTTLTKQLDVAWAVGSGNGGLDTGTIANDTYHVWLIQRSDTGVVDALFSKSASSPMTPPSSDRKRRIGSILRESGSIVAFKQVEDRFYRSLTALDVNETGSGSSQRVFAMSVPTGIAVEWFGSCTVDATSGVTAQVRFYSLLQSDVAVDGNISQVVAIASGSTQVSSQLRGIVTNTSAQIAFRMGVSSSSVTTRVATEGWIDTRGRLAP
jgi:hypothetical protein